MNTWSRRSKSLCCCAKKLALLISICLTCSWWSLSLCCIICSFCLWISFNLCASAFAASAFIRASEKKMTNLSRIKVPLPSASSSYLFLLLHRENSLWPFSPFRWLYMPYSVKAWGARNHPCHSCSSLMIPGEPSQINLKCVEISILYLFYFLLTFHLLFPRCESQVCL